LFIISVIPDSFNWESIFGFSECPPSQARQVQSRQGLATRVGTNDATPHRGVSTKNNLSTIRIPS
jgi:hypothetical protein